MDDELSNKFIFQIILFNFSLLSTSQIYLTYSQFDLLLIFSFSNDRIQWPLDFVPYSVTITVNDRVQNITFSAKEKTLAACQLLLSQNQNFLDNHLPRNPITQNQEGTIEMRDEVLSSVGTQDLNSSSCQVSDLENIDFNWQNSQLDMDTVFRSGIGTHFSPTTFEDLSMGGSIENPFVLDEEEDNENSPPSTPVSVRPTETPRLQRSRAFGEGIGNIPD